MDDRTRHSPKRKRYKSKKKKGQHFPLKAEKIKNIEYQSFSNFSNSTADQKPADCLADGRQRTEGRGKVTQVKPAKIDRTR